MPVYTTLKFFDPKLLEHVPTSGVCIPCFHLIHSFHRDKTVQRLIWTFHKMKSLRATASYCLNASLILKSVPIPMLSFPRLSQHNSVDNIQIKAEIWLFKESSNSKPATSSCLFISITVLSCSFTMGVGMSSGKQEYFRMVFLL